MYKVTMTKFMPFENQLSNMLNVARCLSYGIKNAIKHKQNNYFLLPIPNVQYVYFGLQSPIIYNQVYMISMFEKQ